MSAECLTRAERGDLQKIARMRARQSKSLLDARKAELLADLEEQLAARFPENDPRWAEITAQARRAVEEANEHVLAACRQAGVPEEFAPSLTVVWSGRGANGVRELRTELRRLGAQKIDTSAKTAKAEIERVELEACTAIIADGLRSDEARGYLDRIPTPGQIMAPVSLDEVEIERQANKATRKSTWMRELGS